MPADRVVATYLIESYLPPEQAAGVLAGEQSTGTFTKVARETPELASRFGATVTDVEALPPSDEPPLPGSHRPAGAPPRPGRARVRVTFPLENFGPSLPNLLAAVAGNLYELRELAAVRLLDLDLPGAFAERYPGPRFGVAGTRRLMGVPDAPMIGTIVKPSIGLPLEELRQLVRELAEAGIDFIKDDELIANPPYSPLRERVRVVMEEIDRAADRTGKKVMYAFNITDDIDRLAANHDLVRTAGGDCVMVCVNVVGLAGVAYLRERSALPVHGHRAMIGALMRHPKLGIDFVAFQKLARLAGVDHLHTNGFDNKFYESNDEVLASINAVRKPLFGGYETLPVLSSAQWAGLAPLTYRLTRTTDLLVLAGGGIHGHPDGSAAGVESMRQAWTAAVNGIPPEQQAERSEALRRALATFGAVRR
ncbi:MAG: ribulose-bisphosphate carboxylase large subunit family protein [Nocardiopsaceae bacterium]|nr:ribulose-bisphosphate carboxylase large subunit family protein [Nocardiopsaceae bacterium]